MRRLLFATTLLSIPFFTNAGGCTPQQAKTARDVLGAGELACVMTSTVTDEAALASVCGVVDTLVPILKDLIGVREAARRSGVSWPSPSPAAKDAGAADAAREASK